MKTRCDSSMSAPSHRGLPGFAAMEVVLATVVVLVFTMGLYYLSEKCFSRLYHFISTMVGSPYL